MAQNSPKDGPPQPSDDRQNQIAENLRFYGNARFQQLTLFMGGMTVIAAGMFYEHAHEPAIFNLSIRVVLSMFGMLFVSVIWVMEVRSTIYWATHWSCARSVWPLPTTPGWEWLTASSAVVGLYLASYIALWLCAYQWQAPCWLLWPLTLPCFLILTFMVLMYCGLNRLFRLHKQNRSK